MDTKTQIQVDQSNDHNQRLGWGVRTNDSPLKTYIRRGRILPPHQTGKSGQEVIKGIFSCQT